MGFASMISINKGFVGSSKSENTFHVQKVSFLKGILQKPPKTINQQKQATKVWNRIYYKINVQRTTKEE